MLPRLIFTCLAVLIVHGAVDDQHAREERHAQVAELQAALDALPRPARGKTAHVLLNGATITVGGECGGEGEDCTDWRALDLDAMFPQVGDVPGDDLPGVPRPPNARRTFAATVLESGQAVRIYEGKPADMSALLTSAGWKKTVEGDVELYVRGDERMIVTVDASLRPDTVRFTFARVPSL